MADTLKSLIEEQLNLGAPVEMKQKKLIIATDPQRLVNNNPNRIILRIDVPNFVGATLYVGPVSEDQLLYAMNPWQATLFFTYQEDFDIVSQEIYASFGGITGQIVRIAEYVIVPEV